MANWALPTLSSLYTDFVNEVDARLDDSATMFVAGPSNQPVGAIRFLRATSTFQEWNGTVWADLVIAVPGGGTGATDPGEIVESLDLGTMSEQDANAVNITGGSITGLTLLNMGGNILFASDNAYNIGSNANRPATVYIRSGIVIPVGVDKFVTA